MRMTVKTPTKELLIEKHPYIADPEKLQARLDDKRLDYCLAIKTLDMYINTEYHHYGDYWSLKAIITWCNESCDQKQFSCEYSIEGFNAACEWLDKQRAIYAEQLIA